MVTPILEIPTFYGDMDEYELAVFEDLVCEWQVEMGNEIDAYYAYKNPKALVSLRDNLFFFGNAVNDLAFTSRYNDSKVKKLKCLQSTINELVGQCADGINDLHSCNIEAIF